jgi:hypothetical protein
MNMFEEDYTALMGCTEGFTDMPVEAQQTLRALLFHAWVAGATRVQKAAREGSMLQVAKAMLDETVRVEEERKAAKPTSQHSKEPLQ